MSFFSLVVVTCLSAPLCHFDTADSFGLLVTSAEECRQAARQIAEARARGGAYEGRVEAVRRRSWTAAGRFSRPASPRTACGGMPRPGLPSRADPGRSGRRAERRIAALTRPIAPKRAIAPKRVGAPGAAGSAGPVLLRLLARLGRVGGRPGTACARALSAAAGGACSLALRVSTSLAASSLCRCSGGAAPSLPSPM